MDRQELQRKAQQFIDALHALERDEQDALERMVALYSDNAEISNAMLRRLGKGRRGLDGARTFWREYRDLFSEIHSEFAAVTAGENAAGLFWTSKGQDSAGHEFEYDGASLLVFDDQGKISVFRGYYDTRELSNELGA